MPELDINKKVRQIQLISRKLVDSLLAGNYHSVFKGPGLEFHEVREYIPGDDSRFMDWSVTSRMNTPYVKTFHEEREMILQIIIDMSSSLFFGSGELTKRDMAAMIFAILAFAAEANNDQVGSVLFSDQVLSVSAPQKGSKHILRQISQVLSWNHGGEGSDLSDALRSVLEIMKRRGIIFVLSDFRTSGYWKNLSLLARKHDVVAVRIYDHLDEEFPLPGFYDFIDPESGDRMSIMGSSRTFKKDYRDFWELHTLAWQNGCRKCGIDTLEIGTHEDPGKRLLDFFERRKKR